VKKREPGSTVDALASSHADILKNLQDKSKEELIALFVKHLKEEHHAKDENVRELFEKDELLLPSAIFVNDKLSALETIVKFLKENRGKSLHEIAKALNRDDRSIWTTYHNSAKKLKAPLSTTPSSFFVPAGIFAERKLSVLETLTRHLKEQLGLSLHEIAVALRRDDRTIWTVYDRAKKKLGGAV